MNENDASNWQDVEKRAVSLIDKGHEFQQLGCDEEALASFEKAVSMCHIVSKTSDEVALVLAQALDNKANALMDLNRLAEALPVFDEGIRVHKGIVRGDGTWQDVREIGVSVMNKGRALMLLGSHDEARKCFEHAIDSFEQCESEEDLALAWLNCGEVFVRQDRLVEALAALDQSLTYWETVTANQPDAAKADYAYTLSSKADVLRCLRRYSEAVEMSDRSIKFHRAVMNHTNSPVDRKAMAEAMNLRGHILTELDRIEEAQDCFREAAHLRGAKRGSI